MENKIIKKQIILSASKQLLWQKWTTAEGIKTFFAKECLIELMIGGKYEMYFLPDNPVGLKGSEDCQILSFVPNEMLSFSWNAPPQFETVRNGAVKTWVVILFEFMDVDTTKLTLHHLGWQEGAEWELVYEYFEKAWDQVLKRLKDSI